MMKIKAFFKELISAIYPNKCICCSEVLEEQMQICSWCNENIERNCLDDICLSCGFDKKECVCKYNVYRFNSLVCVFKNCGLARKAYYSYKFEKKQHYANFFVGEMCSVVKHCYKDVNFDLICSVPNANRYQYDHSGFLAKQMSKVLDIPYENNILKCAKNTKKQHKSTIKERLINTEGKYRCNKRIDNKCVLLVDDIKTTGATLDECAKMLLFAGADCVYCVTTLGTSTIK